MVSSSAFAYEIPNRSLKQVAKSDLVVIGKVESVQIKHVDEFDYKIGTVKARDLEGQAGPDVHCQLQRPRR